MVRYVFVWMPVFVVLGTFFVLSSAVVALIALPFVLLFTLAALAGVLVGIPYMLARAVGRRWHGHDPEPAPVPVRAERRD